MLFLLVFGLGVERVVLMQRWRVVCAYDGGGFSGWQSQPDGGGVQDCLEARIAVLTGQPIRIHGSGRTDAGVHARGQVFHFDWDWSHGREALHRALQATLPETLAIRSVAPAPATFHARFSAVGKRYTYRCHRGRPLPDAIRYRCGIGDQALQIKAMHAAVQILCGQHDFTSFCAVARGAEAVDPVKTIWSIRIIERGKDIDLVFEGSGFLYKMVRTLAGTLLSVGAGTLSPAEVGVLLAQRERTAKVVTAPAHGLWLEQVFFRRRKEWTR